MLSDIIEMALDAAEGLSESMMNSGSSPAGGPSTLGSPSSVPSMPGETSPSRDTDPRRDRDTTPRGDDEPSHHDPNYERDAQLRNAGETAVYAGSEVVQSWMGFNSVGKVLGPLATLVSASPAVTEGVALVAGYHESKWNTISEASGDAFGDGSGSDSGDAGGAEDTSSEVPTRRPEIEHSPENQEVLDNIRIKLEMERAAARRRIEPFGGGL